jgi:hypothetical protein
MDVPTIQTGLSIKAQQARQLFCYQTRDDGTGFHSFDFDRYGWDGITASPWHQPLSRVIHSFAGDEDFAYGEVVAALEALSDWNDEADPQDCIDQEATADIYTARLLEWLGLSVYHVDYLSQAATECGVTDGYQLLASAQEIAKREIWYGVVQALVKNIDSQELFALA